MVHLKNHGGHCCGAQHIHGFVGDRLESDFTELYQFTQQRDPCLHEVILNRSQCRDNPRLVAKLAELGYVLTTGFINGNHNSSVYVFHRTGQRLPLNDLPFVWAGQIASPSLRGTLTRLPAPTNANGNGVPVRPRGWFVDSRHIRTGDRFTYHNPSNELHGATLTYRGQGITWHEERVTLFHEATGREYRRAISTLRWYSQAAQPVAPQQLAVPEQRHQEDVERVRTEIRHAEPVRVVVHTTYHNVFRDGRVGPGYLSLEEARNGAPRAGNRQIKRIYSDGTIETEQLG
jgi:hypothetical protein